MKRLSVIIVTYNSEKDIYDCLSSVFAHNDIGDNLEVIIVDNCSSKFEEMRSKIEAEYGSNVVIIKNTENGGYGQGNNIGVRKASAPVVAIMNPDVRIVTPIFAQALETLCEGNTVMCAGKQMYDLTHPALSFNTSLFLPPFIRFALRYYGIKKDKYLQQYMWLQGAFFFIRKDVFEQIGMFDENIFMFSEEFDIHTRLLKQYPNVKIKYLKNYQYLHLAGDREFSLKTYERQLNTGIYLARKFGFPIKKFLKREKRHRHIVDIVSKLKKDNKHNNQYQQISALINQYLNNNEYA